MSSKLKLVLVYVAVVILSIVTAAYFVAPRRVAPQFYDRIISRFQSNPESIFKFDPDISYMLKPNFSGKRYTTDDPHQTNSRSLLGKLEIDNSDPRKKILFLGDSVAYGDGVAFDQTAISLMQKSADAAYILANGSCPGWSTKQELLYFQKYLADLHWDAVVIVFCLNDLASYEWVFDSKGGLKLSAEMENVGGLTGFKENVVESVKLWNIRRGFEEHPKESELAQHSNSCMFAWDKAKWQTYAREVLLPFLSSSNRPPVIVLAMPTLLQLLAKKAGAADKTAFFPQHMLRSYCNLPRVTFIDAAPAFARIEDPRPAYLERDYLHFSPAGQQILASYLWPALAKQLQVQQPAK